MLTCPVFRTFVAKQQSETEPKYDNCDGLTNSYMKNDQLLMKVIITQLQKQNFIALSSYKIGKLPPNNPENVTTTIIQGTVAGGAYLSGHKIVIEENEKQSVVITDCRGVCSDVFKAVGVAIPPTIRAL